MLPAAHNGVVCCCAGVTNFYYVVPYDQVRQTASMLSRHLTRHLTMVQTGPDLPGANFSRGGFHNHILIQANSDPWCTHKHSWTRSARTGACTFAISYTTDSRAWVASQAIEAMMFYQQWAPNLPDIITHRAGIKPDHDSDKSTFYIGGRVSCA
jgi:hypothetical protein